MADINHDLLLAVLALRSGSASGDTLRGVFTEWSQNPDRPLSELLRDQGILDEGHLEGRRSAWFVLICAITTEIFGQALTPAMRMH